MAQGKCTPELQVAARRKGARQRALWPAGPPASRLRFGIDFANVQGEIVYKQREVDMRATKLATAVGTVALLLCALVSASGAQEKARQRAPIIRVYSSNGSYVLQTTSYVTPVIEVSENAYVFAVSMDVDGHIQVPVSYTHLRAHETRHDLVCRLLLE